MVLLLPSKTVQPSKELFLAADMMEVFAVTYIDYFISKHTVLFCLTGLRDYHTSGKASSCWK